MPSHPLHDLDVDETQRAKTVLFTHHPNEMVYIREIFLQEPAKAELVRFLEQERAGHKPTWRPKRLAQCQYDILTSISRATFHEAVVDLDINTVIEHEIVHHRHHAPVKKSEFEPVIAACHASKEFQLAISELQLPEGFDVVIEPWPYGGPDTSDTENRRYFQGLVFAQDTRSANKDANFYAFPLPLIPVMDAETGEIVRIDKLATGGKQDGLGNNGPPTHKRRVIEHCRAAEYAPELLPNGVRRDVKPLDVVQPRGPSFTVSDKNLVEWQKWRFRVSFNQREGAVIHDVHFDNRSVFFRLSISEMTVPYADARSPFHRKQAFDFGDGGAGNYANTLGLGCDCLGAIHYFDGVVIAEDDTIRVNRNVVCLHEQDNGIGWKHTNWRSGRSVVVRNRELVVQFIITLANYEYIFAYKFNQAGGIDIETRATGIVSGVNIDPGKTSEYGNVVGQGVLAQNHQHIFAVRIDPAIDGHLNTMVQEESISVPTSPLNPRGNFYAVKETPFLTAAYADAAPFSNRVFKIINENHINSISGKPVGYKLVTPATQLLLAQPSSIQARRALFAQHHLWVTRYKDNELYAAGRYTLQSRDEVGGVAEAVARQEDVRNQDLVVWAVFGITHNPRVEDWPVMPVEIHQIHLRPADFFEANPSIDVPSERNVTSISAIGLTCPENHPRL